MHGPPSYPANPPTDDPANHLMMASAPLVAQAPDAPQLHQTWTASGAIIKELLNLSSSINLEGEITLWKHGTDSINILTSGEWIGIRLNRRSAN